MTGSFGFALALLWRGDATLGQWIFAVALFALFFISTIYHGLVSERAKEVARALDHIAIFALIAGTYTPFALGPLRAHGGILLFALEWLLTLIGLAFVLCGGLNRIRVSNALYIGMGWTGLFFVSGFLSSVAPARQRIDCCRRNYLYFRCWVLQRKAIALLSLHMAPLRARRLSLPCCCGIWILRLKEERSVKRRLRRHCCFRPDNCVKQTKIDVSQAACRLPRAGLLRLSVPPRPRAGAFTLHTCERPWR